MNSLDIVMIEYKDDAFVDNFVSVTDESAALENEKFMDLNPSLGYGDAGYLVCYYTKRDLNTAVSIEDLTDVNATYSAMAYRVVAVSSSTWSEEKLAEISIPNMLAPLVLDFSVETRKMEQF